jgi:putative ABC transport system permease protein
MTVVIKERTKEIGVRKALGATPTNIIAQILKESILITGLFGVIGLTAGVFLMELIGSFMQEENEMFYNPGIDFSVALISTIIIILSGTFSGLIPAIRAASIKPIEALRDE